MKIKSFLLTAAVLSLISSTALAGGNITNVVAYADGDGAFSCSIYTWPNTASGTLYGDQFWGPGHLYFNVASDTEEDPVLTLNSIIDNDTGFAWAGYQVNIFMNKTFTIPSALLNSPSGWSVASYTPSATSTGTNWFGQINFAGSPAIDPGQQIDFTYQVAFAGSVQFTQEMIPIAVPEPAAGSLLILAGLLAGWRTGRRCS